MCSPLFPQEELLRTTRTPYDTAVDGHITMSSYYREAILKKTRRTCVFIFTNCIVIHQDSVLFGTVPRLREKICFGAR